MILNLASAASRTTDAKIPETDEVTNALLKRVLKARLELGEDDLLIPDARAILASAVVEDEPSYVYPFGHVSNVLTKVAEILSLGIASPTVTRPVIQRLTILNTPTTSPYHIRLWDSVMDFPSPTSVGGSHKWSSHSNLGATGRRHHSTSGSGA
ncbi:hypothetical protein AAF712_016375 [Marasmius tenuissimus]|uniref:Uncharacterized protein n=1 Tax=Marasmius tenuissimus TaxID=585030 RepID=A0ABR2Z6V8_9AGAR